MRPILNRTVEAAALPVSVADLKVHLRIDHNDDDAYLTAILGAVVDQIEKKTKRAIMVQTWIQSQPCPNGANVIWLEMPPINAVTAVTYYDKDFALQTATLADFAVLDQNDGFKVLRPAPGKVWPDYTTERDDALRVTFTAGADTEAGVPLAKRCAITSLVRKT